jgi:CIC family chloride channel protein
MLEASGEPHLPVLGRTAEGEPRLVGALHLVDALRVYNRALAATAAEEHS